DPAAHVVHGRMRIQPGRNGRIRRARARAVSSPGLDQRRSLSTRPVRARLAGLAKPVLLVADSDPVSRRRLTDALDRRFGSHYHVHAAATADAAISLLHRLHTEADDVALVIADLRLSGGGGAPLLGHARECFPGIACILLTTIGDEQASGPLHQALALG